MNKRGDVVFKLRYYPKAVSKRNFIVWLSAAADY
jgi:hypothetical protein